MRFLWLALFLFVTTVVPAQDSLYTRRVIQELTSEKYNGRGYVKSGDSKAANYIAAEFKRIGLQPGADGSRVQEFSFPVNTFPGTVSCALDGQTLQPGIDFIVDPGMSSISGMFDVVTITRSMASYTSSEIKGRFVLLDTNGTGFSIDKEDLQAWKKNVFGAAGMIWVQPTKLTWSVSTKDGRFPVIEVLKNSVHKNVKKIRLDVCAKYVAQHTASNVIGMIPGMMYPDSFVFVTAHYDHLGRMGTKAFFPGANDNASGISMLMNLAAHFVKPENRLPLTMVFIAFAGEEAGLLGSKYYTEHPLVPLKKIRFLLNLDLLGTGDEGMMVVNATEFPAEFSLLDSLNTSGSSLPKLGQRGKAANSDHYYFTEKGVPAFFCYTLGGITAYHDVYDIEKTLPLTKYKEVFGLFTAFLSKITALR